VTYGTRRTHLTAVRLGDVRYDDLRVTFGPGGAALKQRSARVHTPLVYVDSGLHIVESIDYEILLGEELVCVYRVLCAFKHYSTRTYSVSIQCKYIHIV